MRLPPLTGHELIGTRIDGSCFGRAEAELRRRTRALHQRITKLKRSHLQLIEHYLEDMRVCSTRKGSWAAARWPTRRSTSRPTTTTRECQLTEAAVAAQRAAISRLAHPSTWDEVPATKKRKWKAAAYCGMWAVETWHRSCTALPTQWPRERVAGAHGDREARSRRHNLKGLA